MSSQDDQDDPVEKMLKEAGCLDKHYKVQECIAESKDWRKCQSEVASFRVCIENHQKQLQQGQKTTK